LTILWLLRHGQTDWNLTGRWQGQTPAAPGLNETGRQQALAACAQLSHIRFSAIYSSDLLRSVQTAELIAQSLGLAVTLEPRLREIDLGAWEGMLSEDIKARYPKEMEARAADPIRARAPDGESPADVVGRVRSALDDIAAAYPDRSVLIVAHGLSLAVIFCLARHIPIAEVYENIPENGKPFRVDWSRDSHTHA
jgi:probable phosphoglycerate mutase